MPKRRTSSFFMSSLNKFFLLLNELTDLRPILRISNTSDHESAAVLLAEAIAASPPWNFFNDAVLVVRPSPFPLIAVMGNIEPENEQRLLQLRWQIGRLLPTLRYIDFSEAKRQCTLLAEKLRDMYTRDEIDRFRFTALPRGGMIVLGMLSYALQLSHAQLEPPHSPDQTTVVVDDCVISGANFGRFLQSLTSKQVIFAHLYSHPDLRSAILTREDRVVACLSSSDLEDIAPQLYGSDYSSWKRRWESRMGSSAYWVGQPEYIAFAWNEPDISFWNPAAKNIESGWNLLSPSLCLKNCFASATIRDQIQIQPEGPGPLRPAESVVFARFQSGILVGNTKSEDCYYLQETEADIWSRIISLGTVDRVVSALSAEYSVDVEKLRKDVSAFIEQLQKAGLLIQTYGTEAESR